MHLALACAGTEETSAPRAVPRHMITNGVNSIAHIQSALYANHSLPSERCNRLGSNPWDSLPKANRVTNLLYPLSDVEIMYASYAAPLASIVRKNNGDKTVRLLERLPHSFRLPGRDYSFSRRSGYTNCLSHVNYHALYLKDGTFRFL